MGIWKSKTWPPAELAFLKWSSIFFGMILGAFIPDFIREHLWVFILTALLLAIRPIRFYFDDNGENQARK